MTLVTQTWSAARRIVGPSSWVARTSCTMSSTSATWLPATSTSAWIAESRRDHRVSRTKGAGFRKISATRMPAVTITTPYRSTGVKLLGSSP